MGGDNPPYNFEKMEEKRMGIDMKAFMKPELKDRGRPITLWKAGRKRKHKLRWMS